MKKIIIDNQIAKIFAHCPIELLNDPIISNLNYHVSFRWPSLLEYLGLGSVLSHLPIFYETEPLLQASIATLHANEEKEVLFYIYDRLFAEILTQIKSLPQLNASYLLQEIDNKCADSSFSAMEKVLTPSLAFYKTALSEKASNKIHDLILYLAWDRLCVCMASLFNYQSTDSKFIRGLDVLKGCLIESYQHIVQQRRTSPGLYRMLEALFFYQMREENLQKHTDAEWNLLSQSFHVLKAQDELVDCFYIDDFAIFNETDHNYLTLDLPDRVNSRLALVQLMMDKLKEEIPEWGYSFRVKEILYIKV